MNQNQLQHTRSMIQWSIPNFMALLQCKHVIFSCDFLSVNNIQVSISHKNLYEKEEITKPTSFHTNDTITPEMKKKKEDIQL